MLTLSADLAAIITPGALAFDDLSIVEHDPRLDAPLAAAEAQVRRWDARGDGPQSGPANGVERAGSRAQRSEPGFGAEPRVSMVRTMYKQVGLDPTKTRPSSEALLRRVRRGDPLPRINSLVDICNWCSLELQLPYGLYDLDHIEGEVMLRLGHPGEEYAGIRKDAVHVGGRLTLADAVGPFGNPTSDSARTMVTPATRRALMVIFMPQPIRAGLDGALAVSAARVLEYAGGRETARAIVSGS